MVFLDNETIDGSCNYVLIFKHDGNADYLNEHVSMPHGGNTGIDQRVKYTFTPIL